MSTNQNRKWKKPMIADPPIDPPEDGVDPRVVYLAELCRMKNVMDQMQHTMVQMQADTFRIIAANVARSAPPAIWRPLKNAAVDTGVGYETCRYWAEHGVIVAEKRGGRWFIRMDSLQAHVGALWGK